MPNRFFFTADGQSWREYDEGSIDQIPEGAIEWPTRPAHGLDRLVNGEIVPYVPVAPLNARVAAAFGALPIEIQDKYLEQITNFRTLFDYGNVLLLLRRLGALEAALDLPAEQAVKDIIDAAKAELQELSP